MGLADALFGKKKSAEELAKEWKQQVRCNSTNTARFINDDD